MKSHASHLESYVYIYHTHTKKCYEPGIISYSNTLSHGDRCFAQNIVSIWIHKINLKCMDSEAHET